MAKAGIELPQPRRPAVRGKHLGLCTSGRRLVPRLDLRVLFTALLAAPACGGAEPMARRLFFLRSLAGGVPERAERRLSVLATVSAASAAP